MHKIKVDKTYGKKKRNARIKNQKTWMKISGIKLTTSLTDEWSKYKHETCRSLKLSCAYYSMWVIKYFYNKWLSAYFILRKLGSRKPKN